MALYLTDENGVPHKVASGGSGMENPMTTAGDLIVGGASGSPTRLGIGTAGQGLKVNSAGTGPEYGQVGGLKIVAKTTLSSNASSITINNLDINADGGFYMVVVQCKPATQYYGNNQLKFNNVNSGYNEINLQSTKLSSASSGDVTPTGYHGKSIGYIDFGQTYSVGNTNVCFITQSENCINAMTVSGSYGEGSGAGGAMDGYINVNNNAGFLNGQSNLTSITISTSASGGYKAGTTISIFKVVE